MDGQIIYFGDPMCSWCYGFAPHISVIRDHFKNVLDFRLVMGGLRPGGKERIGEIGDFLKHHWEEVHNRSGQPFSYDIFKNPEFIYDTEPPCRAVIVSREMDPEKEFDYFKEVQKAFYKNNSDTNQILTYTDIAGSVGLDPGKFRSLYTSDEIKDKTWEDFKFSRDLGVRVFPTTVLKHNNEMYLIANGYLEAESIIPLIDKVLASDS